MTRSHTSSQEENKMEEGEVDADPLASVPEGSQGGDDESGDRPDHHAGAGGPGSASQ